MTESLICVWKEFDNVIVANYFSYGHLLIFGLEGFNVPSTVSIYFI